MTTQAMRRASASWPAGVPAPVEQCDGSWRVPIWTPENGWHMSWWDTTEKARIVTRAGCGDRECIAIHQDDLTRKQLATIRLHNPAALVSERVQQRRVA